MPIANVNDRASIERVYPAEAYAADASVNERPKAETLHGVRVRSGPDAAGDFELAPARQHVGEEPGAAFLAPHRRDQAHDRAMTDPDPRAGYAAFVDDIIRTAGEFGFEPAASPGPGDPRLRGLRQ